MVICFFAPSVSHQWDSTQAMAEQGQEGTKLSPAMLLQVQKGMLEGRNLL